jgi:hypothetical protein
MTKYTCRFLNGSGRIDDVESFDSSTDGLAQQRASQLLAKSSFAAIELWERDRLVFRDEKAS